MHTKTTDTHRHADTYTLQIYTDTRNSDMHTQTANTHTHTSTDQRNAHTQHRHTQRLRTQIHMRTHCRYTNTTDTFRHTYITASQDEALATDSSHGELCSGKTGVLVLRPDRSNVPAEEEAQGAL